jgi:putative spermidine/putrescine transport system permease protein
MQESRAARVLLRVATGATLVFIYAPIAVIVLYSFNGGLLQSWPIRSLTIDWYVDALSDTGIRNALLASLQAAIGATAVALVLGSLMALAVHRFRFFGRETLSFVVILPIALPGIVTGIALNTAFRALGLDLGLITVIVGHATFCVVVIYNNVIARLRRTARSAEEASMDLGADTFQTFRRITFPTIVTALVAGGLLAFALSFDEIIVTTFTAGSGIQTLPIWIFSNYQRPNQLPLVNVAAVLVLLLSIIPVYLSQRLSSDRTGYSGARL